MIERSELQVLSGSRADFRAMLFNQVPITYSSLSERWPRLSPDGLTVAYVQTVGTNADIYLVPLAGGPAQQLTSWPGLDDAPTWSADSQRLAFNSDRDGDSEIYTIRRDGSGLTQLTNNAAADGFALWAQ